jgi:uncharacterized protein YcbX
MAKAGTITAIWRYPVKSMIGEELDDSALAEQGLLPTAPGARHHRVETPACRPLSVRRRRPQRSGGAEGEYGCDAMTAVP